MTAPALTSVRSPRPIRASTRSWEQEATPSRQGVAHRYFFTSGASSEPQNNMIIPVNEAPVHLLQPPSLPLLLNAGVNVLVMMGFSGATVNIQRGASAGVWDLPLYQTLAGRAIESASTVETVTTPMDALVAELEELRELPEGWDGEGAAAPISDAIDDAMSFVRSVGDRASRLAPTPDVDGSILLEIDDGGAGSFRFRGDGTIIHAIRGVAPGIVRFDSRTVPQELSEALEAAL